MVRDLGVRNPARILWLSGALLAVLAVGLWGWQTRTPETWGGAFDHHRLFAKPGSEPRRPRVRAVPPGRGQRLPVTRDTWLSNVGAEARGSNGGADRLKLKTYQEFSLVDCDFAPLRGRVVEAATLHLKLAAAPILHRVSVGTVAAPWVEGTATRYQAQAGSSTFEQRIAGEESWSFPGSDITSVILGAGHTLWGMSDATPPTDDGWQKVAVEPAVVAANTAGLSHGLVLFDDQGLEWRVQGEAFQKENPANRFVVSRSGGEANAPWLEVWLGAEDGEPPVACEPLPPVDETASLPAGEALVHWRTPADAGPAGPLGFEVEFNGQPVPRHLVPLAGAPGDVVELHLRDLPTKTDEDATEGGLLRVRCVDAAGNVGPATEWRVTRSQRQPVTLPKLIPDDAQSADAAGLAPPKVGEVAVSFLDTLDKVHPERGDVVPEAPAGYRLKNHLWDARTRTLTLRGARNELVGWQLLLEGGELSEPPRLELEGLTANEARLRVEWWRGVLVAEGAARWPDPLLPLDAGTTGSEGGSRTKPSGGRPGDGNGASERFQGLWGELQIPAEAPAGEHWGRLQLTRGDSTLEVRVRLEVWPWALPDRLSFIPEMNAYGSPEKSLEVYRLAHRHRTVWNRLPYSQSGQIKGNLAPTVRDGVYDWQAYDAAMGPLFDGTAFADLPRAGVPLETCYLPLHENWPVPINEHYDGGYWADLALTDEYRAEFAAGVAEFARHLHERGWNQTQFQVYFNNKVNYKQRRWRDGSSPWILDEPASFQDFWAVGWLGHAVRSGLEQAGTPSAPLVFRIDISRPQFQRDVFDPVLDYNVCAGAAGRRYRRLLLDNARKFGQQLVDYGTSNPVSGSNVQPAAWCVESWARGADGVLPWNTLGRPESWRKADQLAIFYPPAEGFSDEAAPSLRLKAYLRGQQDVEYLALWQQATGQPRWAVGSEVLRQLPFDGRVESTGHTGDEDAGAMAYPRLRPSHLAELREAIARDLLRRGSWEPVEPRALVPARRGRQRHHRAGGYVSVGEQP